MDGCVLFATKVLVEAGYMAGIGCVRNVILYQKML